MSEVWHLTRICSDTKPNGRYLTVSRFLFLCSIKAATIFLLIRIFFSRLTELTAALKSRFVLPETRVLNYQSTISWKYFSLFGLNVTFSPSLLPFSHQTRLPGDWCWPIKVTSALSRQVYLSLRELHTASVVVCARHVIRCCVQPANWRLVLPYR